MDLNTQQEVHLSHYWNVIRKRWKVAAAILDRGDAGHLPGELLLEAAVPLARSRSRSSARSNAVTIEDLFGIAASDQEFLQTQYVLLKSRGLALRVVDDHKLYNDPELNPAGIAGKTPQEIAADQGRHRRRRCWAASTSRRCAARRWSTSRTSARSPRLAQKIAEAWGESFIRMNIAKKLESVQQASEFLTTQIATVQADLELSRKELHGLRPQPRHRLRRRGRRATTS